MQIGQEIKKQESQIQDIWLFKTEKQSFGPQNAKRLLPNLYARLNILPPLKRLKRPSKLVVF